MRTQISKSGLINFHMDRSKLFSKMHLAKYIANSKKIKILGITLRSIIDEIGESKILELALAGKEFKFQVLDPDSPLVPYREHQEKKPPNFLKWRINDTILTIRSLRRQLPEDMRDNIKISLYEVDYSALIILLDKFAFFSPYLEGEDANHSAIFLFKKVATGMYGRLDKHYKKIKKSSTDVSRPLAVMLCGHTAAGKTSLAKNIKLHLKFPIIHTFKIRHGLFSYLTEPADYILTAKRYQETAAKVYCNLNLQFEDLIQKIDKGLILDGSFPFKEYREPIYKICKKYDVFLTVIECTCDDIDEVKRRLKERKEDATLLPTERARDYEVYESSLKDSNYIKNEQELKDQGCLSCFLIYDTYTKVKHYGNNLPVLVDKYLNKQ